MAETNRMRNRLNPISKFTEWKLFYANLYPNGNGNGNGNGAHGGPISSDLEGERIEHKTLTLETSGRS